MAVVTADGVRYSDLEGEPVEPEIVHIDWNPTAAEKGAYRHFMQKEIFEQGRSLTDTLRSRLDFEGGQVVLDTLSLSPEQLRAIAKVTIVACGTSYYAGLVGKYYIERLARLPVEVDYASEFRYRRADRRCQSSGRWPSPRAARRWTRWLRWRKRAPAVRSRLRSSTRSAARPRGSPTGTSTCRRVRRSAWPAPRPLPRPRPTSSCSRSTWARPAVCWTRRPGPR